MEKNEKRTLFFLRSPKHNLTAIEGFLKKRDFNVVSISDYKEAVGKVIPLNPDYIFIAWDHPQEQIMNLPKLLNQSCTSKIIPYINSSDKHQHRKLQACSMDPKLFPPLSGPGIQRMIAKIEQSAAAAERASGDQDRKEKSSPSSSTKKSDMIQIRSTFKGELGDMNSKLNRNESTLMPDDSDGSRVNRSESTFLDGNEKNEVQNRNESTLLADDQSDQSMFREKTRADQLRDFQKGLHNRRNKITAEGDASETGPADANGGSGG